MTVPTVFPWHEEAFEALLSRTMLPHAIMFAGPEGMGKLAYAQALAAALVCETGKGHAPACGQCPGCHWTTSESHPDVKMVEPYAGTESKGPDGETIEKDAKKYIVVDQIRALADFIGLSSHRGGARVIIVHPAETLNTAAANALLKNLEEPPPATYFLLVSHRPQMLLPTIKSRCQIVTTGHPAEKEALAWLATQGVEQPGLALANTGGAPLRAARLTDDDYWRPRSAFLRVIAPHDFDVLQAADVMKDFEPAAVLEWLQKWTYDLVSQKAVGRIRYNVDQSTAIAAAAGRIDALSALRFHRKLVRMQRVISHPLNVRLLYEDLLGIYSQVARGRAWR